MKNFLFALTLILPMLAFTACGGDDDEPESDELVGTTWVSTDDDPEFDYYLTETISFKKGSKCIYSVYEKEDGKVLTDASANGTYTYSKPIVNVTLTHGGETVSQNFTISGNKMTDEEGYVFIRK